jgi:aryl-alcohol dehydrogenase-like predicted oxidoreductase
MNLRKFGRTGLKVSELTLGTMAFGRWISQEESEKVLNAALEVGIKVIDTADMYGKGQDNGSPLETGESETILGNILKEKRQHLILATKVHGKVGTDHNDQGQSRYHIMRAVENSLKRLQTDYIDLYQVHRFDASTPLEETLRALDDLVRQGKVRYIGCSNYAAWQIAKAHGISELRNLHQFESVQPEYSILSREIEKELLPFCESERVGVITYSPLGRGLLTGKYQPGETPPVGSRGAAGENRLNLLTTERNFKIIEKLKPMAEKREWSLAQFALSWVLSNPIISSAIIGASRQEHIYDTVKHMNKRLTETELKEIDAISLN